jgi:hypothetical protein
MGEAEGYHPAGTTYNGHRTVSLISVGDGRRTGRQTFDERQKQHISGAGASQRRFETNRHRDRSSQPGRR